MPLFFTVLLVVSGKLGRESPLGAPHYGAVAAVPLASTFQPHFWI